MASGSSMPFSSLHPVPTGDRKPKSLGEFIARVQAERGFRNVTEESLKEEVENKKNGVGEVKEEDTTMVEGDDEDEEPLDAGAARMEVLRNIELVLPKRDSTLSGMMANCEPPVPRKMLP